MPLNLEETWRQKLPPVRKEKGFLNANVRSVLISSEAGADIRRQPDYPDSMPIQSESISDGIRQGIYPGLTEERIYPLTIMEADPRCNTGIPSEIDRWPVAPMVTGLVF